MKHFALASLALVLAMTGQAQARTVMPNLYAHSYCRLRQSGVANNDAMRLALLESSISGNEWLMIEVDGKQVRSDYHQAAVAVVQLCPSYLKP